MDNPTLSNQTDHLARRTLGLGAVAAIGGVIAASTITGRAEATELGTAFVNIAEPPYNAVLDGVTDNAVAITQAIDDHPGGATLYFPQGTCVANGGIPLRSNFRFIGAGKTLTQLQAKSGPLFVMSGTVYYAEMANLKLSCSGGHLIGTNGHSFNQSIINECHLIQYNGAYSVFHLDGPGAYIDNMVSNCEINRPANATVPAWLLRGPGGNKNSNRWSNLRLNGSDASTYFIHIEETGSTSYAYDNVFIGITAERCAGGILKALTVQGLTCISINAWDATIPHTADLIHVNRSANGYPSRSITFIACGNRGGTLAAGVKEINCVNGGSTQCTFIANDHAGGGSVISGPPSSFFLGAEPVGGGGGALRAPSLGVANAAVATSPGSIVRKVEIFDMSGASLGYIPIYNTIT